MKQKNNILILVILAVIFFNSPLKGQNLKIGLLKYSGGGDWYANPTSLPNLKDFCNLHLNTNIEEVAEVSPGNINIYNYPFVHMTGHGNVIFNSQEVINLRKYLLSGGFLHIDDNYGMNQYIRRELKKLFPNKELIELPHSHAIYNQKYQFDRGLPKIHRHDGKAPQGFGIMHKGKVIVFYSYESDLGDGWEDPSVHNDTEENHQKALEMGANIIQYAFHY